MGEPEKIRVLISDDVPETRENIRRLLQFESDIEVVATVKNGKEAIQLAEELSPDVVLMDINMPDIDGIKATEQIRQKHPFVQVVILSVQDDQNYMRRALQVGARDFLAKPPQPDDLIHAVRRAGKVAWDERAKNLQAAPVGLMSYPQAGSKSTSRGKIILVYSPKGGSGCTTIAVNLAICLHNEETRVAIVDANFQFGDVAIFMNEHGKNTILDLAVQADEIDQELISEVMTINSTSGVHILASPPSPENAEKITAEQFTKVLRQLQQMYAYVIVDASAHLTDITLAIIDTCDAIVLITIQDIPSIKNNRIFLDLLQTLAVPAQKVTFVMNRFDKRIPITPERVSTNIRQKISAVIPLDEQTVINAVNKGVPFMVDNKNSPAAKGVYSLAEVLKETLMAKDSEEKGKSPSGVH
jgi:pilus assembly protein CpaE